MKTTIRKLGNSQGVLIPKPLLAQVGLVGEAEMRVEDGALVLRAPMTTGSRPAPFRIPVAFGGKRGLILLDQIRALDKLRLIRRLGTARGKTLMATLSALQEVFAE